MRNLRNGYRSAGTVLPEWTESSGLKEERENYMWRGTMQLDTNHLLTK